VRSQQSVETQFPAQGPIGYLHPRMHEQDRAVRIGEADFCPANELGRSTTFERGL
jgi:hypothetical protein